MGGRDRDVKQKIIEIEECKSIRSCNRKNGRKMCFVVFLSLTLVGYQIEDLLKTINSSRRGFFFLLKFENLKIGGLGVLSIE